MMSNAILARECLDPKRLKEQGYDMLRLCEERSIEETMIYSTSVRLLSELNIVKEAVTKDTLDYIVYYLSKHLTQKQKNGIVYTCELYNRAKRYLPMIKETFRANGVPIVFAYLPAVESQFNPRADNGLTENDRALGLWQFQSRTQKAFGLNDPLDPVESTHKVAQLFKTSKMELGSWELALVAHNWGSAGIQKYLNGNDGLYDILHTLPQQPRCFFHHFAAIVFVFDYLDANPKLCE